MKNRILRYIGLGDHSGKILITGATGHVGSKVFNILEGESVDVRGAIRNFDKAKELELNIDDLTYFDYTKPETFEEAFEDIEKVLFIAPPLDPKAFELLKPAINYAIEKEVKHIVVLSAFGVEQSDEIPLRKIELHVKNSGIPYTIVRPNFFMENFTTGFLSESIKDNGEIVIPAGDGKTSFIDTRDIAAVIVEILINKIYINQVYILTGPEALDHYEIASIVSEIWEKEVKYKPISEEDMRDALKSRGIPEENINMTVGLYDPVRKGFNAQITDDARKVLGRDPVTFKQFLIECTSKPIEAAKIAC
jgi:uncharacterized protein YbjT (DUF2867 family)